MKKTGKYKGYRYTIILPKMISGKHKNEYNNLIKIIGKNTILDRINNLESENQSKDKYYKINSYIYNSDLNIYTIHIIENISGNENLVRNIYIDSEGKVITINDIFKLNELVKIFNLYNHTNDINISENDIILSGVLNNIILKNDSILIGKSIENKYDNKYYIIPLNRIISLQK